MTGGASRTFSKGGYYRSGGNTMLEYEEAPHAITGPQVRLYEYPEYSDICEAVTAAINDLSERQGCHGKKICVPENY